MCWVWYGSNRFGLVLQVEGAAGGSLPKLLGPGFGMYCNRFGLVLQVKGGAGLSMPELLGPGFGMVVTGLVWCCRWRVLLTDLPELLGPGFGMYCNWFGLVLQVEGAADGSA
jgi:hypothetical protein